VSSIWQILTECFYGDPVSECPVVKLDDFYNPLICTAFIFCYFSCLSRYRVIRDPAGWLSVAKNTGLIKVKNPMDRESVFVKDNKYTALIGAYDNGG